MANETFISYRRSDDPSFAGRLCDHLEVEFPSEVFMDVASIQPAERSAELEGRLIAMLEWAASAGHALRWGSGAKYGSAQIIPKGTSATALSFDTSGMAYVYMNELERMGVFRSAADREAFVDRLNTVQGIAIKRERAGNAFVGFKIGNVDPEDIEKLLRVIDAELEKRAS